MKNKLKIGYHVFGGICAMVFILVLILNKKTISDVCSEIIPLSVTGKITNKRESSGFTMLSIGHDRYTYYFCIDRPSGGPDFSELAHEGDSIRKESNVDSLFLYKNGIWIGWKIY